MVEVTKEEKMAILERYPNVHVRRTMKTESKRGRYFMVEAPGPMRMLQWIRSGKLVEEGGESGGS